MRYAKSSAALTMLMIEHNRFDKVLDILEKQVNLIEEGKHADYKLLELAVDYFLTFSETCHHPKENLLFSRVIAQKPDDSGVVGNLIGEHKELSELTQRTMDELESRTDESQLSDNALSTLKAFLRYYRHHIKTENENFFPYVLNHLTQDEFNIIDFDLFDREDPVYDNETEGRFARLREEIVALGGEL